MNVTIELIKSFNPCSDRINNFEFKYPTFNATLVELLKLEDVPYSDKIWVATKVCDSKVLQMWAVLCAESVLHIYEDAYPGDTRIRDCLEVTKRVINGELSSDSVELKNARSAASASAASAAYSAARAANSAANAAYSAASAAYSAASAANSATNAAYSAACAAYAANAAANSAASASAANAAYSAACAANSAAREEQEDLNLVFLISLL